MNYSIAYDIMFIFPEFDVSSSSCVCVEGYVAISVAIFRLIKSFLLHGPRISIAYLYSLHILL